MKLFASAQMSRQQQRMLASPGELVARAPTHRNEQRKKTINLLFSSSGNADMQARPISAGPRYKTTLACKITSA